MNENYNDCHHRKTRRTFLYSQNAKNFETFLYPKSQTLCKKLDNFRYVFIYKKAIHFKSLKLAFIYKKRDTLRYVTFLYTKS